MVLSSAIPRVQGWPLLLFLVHTRSCKNTMTLLTPELTHQALQRIIQPKNAVTVTPNHSSSYSHVYSRLIVFLDMGDKLYPPFVADGGVKGNNLLMMSTRYPLPEPVLYPSVNQSGVKKYSPFWQYLVSCQVMEKYNSTRVSQVVRGALEQLKFPTAPSNVGSIVHNLCIQFQIWFV